MTAVLSGRYVASRINERFPGAVTEFTEEYVIVEAERLVEVCNFLRSDAELDMKYLMSITGVDRLDQFEVVYHLCSLRRNHAMVLKARALDYENPSVPSVVSVWKGALFQERETYDLMGIQFEGHPDLRRLFLWEGFPGHPLRKSFLGMPGGVSPGLPKFARED